MKNPLAALPSPPRVSSRFRPRHGTSALCLSDGGQPWESLVVNLSSDYCRLVWISARDRLPLSRLRLRNYKGEIVEVAAHAVSTEQSSNVWVVDCQFSDRLSTAEVARLL